MTGDPAFVAVLKLVLDVAAGHVTYRDSWLNPNSPQHI